MALTHPLCYSFAHFSSVLLSQQYSTGSICLPIVHWHRKSFEAGVSTAGYAIPPKLMLKRSLYAAICLGPLEGPEGMSSSENISKIVINSDAFLTIEHC